MIEGMRMDTLYLHAHMLNPMRYNHLIPMQIDLLKTLGFDVYCYIHSNIPTYIKDCL